MTVFSTLPEVRFFSMNKVLVFLVKYKILALFISKMKNEQEPFPEYSLSEITIMSIIIVESRKRVGRFMSFLGKTYNGRGVQSKKENPCFLVGYLWYNMGTQRKPTSDLHRRFHEVRV